MSESIARSTVKKLDIFSLPFQFTFGNNEKEKKTVVGGIISLIILLLSATYLVYLCYLYFANKIQPQISTNNVFSKESFPMEFTQDFIAVKIIAPNGKTLYDFQKEKGKVYLNMISQFDQNGGQLNLHPFPLVPCESPELVGYLCFDMKSFNKGKDSVFLNYNPTNVEKETLNIFFQICEQATAPAGIICEDEQVIRDTLITYMTQITVRVKLQQFNTKTKEYEERIKEEPFYFDTKIAFYTKFNFQKTDITINEGFIIQSANQNSFFSDFKRKDITATQDFIKSQIQIKILGGLVFFIGQESLSLEIQFPQFTTLLAQFTSVFNSLLFIGIISKFFAQTEIMQQLAELQLKVYFKKTALFLLGEIGFKNELKQAWKGGQLNLWNYVKSVNFKNIGQRMNISILKKVKLIFLGDIKREKEEPIQMKIFKQLLGQSNKALNIFEIQRELLQIRIMLRLLLSVEQYAAMQLCGSQLPTCQDAIDEQQEQEQSQLKDDEKSFKMKSQVLSFQQDNIKQDQRSATVYPLQGEKQLSVRDRSIQVEKQISHLEKIDMIERNEVFFQSCVDKFLENKYPQSEIDRRILECMIGVNETKSNENSLKL